MDRETWKQAQYTYGVTKNIVATMPVKKTHQFNADPEIRCTHSSSQISIYIKITFTRQNFLVSKLNSAAYKAKDTMRARNFFTHAHNA